MSIDTNEAVRWLRSQFDRRSPFAFMSDPDAAEQVVIGLRDGELKGIRTIFDEQGLADDRVTVIRELRIKRHEVIDVGNWRRLPDEMRPKYRPDMSMEMMVALLRAVPVEGSSTPPDETPG